MLTVYEDSLRHRLCLEDMFARGSTSLLYLVGRDVVYKRYESDGWIDFSIKEQKLELQALESIDDVIIPFGKVFDGADETSNSIITGHLMPKVRVGKLANLSQVFTSLKLSLKDKVGRAIEAENITVNCHKSSSHIIIGDANSSNFFLNKKGILKFGDFDNVGIGDFPFDAPSYYTLMAKRLLGDIEGQDIDRVAFGLMALEELCEPRDQLGIAGGIRYQYIDRSQLMEQIDVLHMPVNSKEMFREIVSDTKRKPYIGEAIKEIGKLEGHFLTKGRRC